MNAANGSRFAVTAAVVVSRIADAAVPRDAVAADAAVVASRAKTSAVSLGKFSAKDGAAV